MAALLLALLLAVPAKDPGRALAQRVQAFYAHSKDFSASFRQHYTYVAIGRTEDSEGVVQVKKPGLVRWDYANPDRRTLYIEGRTLWIWRPDDQEAQVKRDFGVEQLGSAFTFLWGKGNLLKEFSPKSVPTPAGLPQGDALELRSEEHTSELQSPCNLVCRLLLEKKKDNQPDERLRAPSRDSESFLSLH